MNKLYPNTPFLNHSAIVSHIYYDSIISIAKSEEFNRLCKWLCKTPKTTVVRVNLMKTTTENCHLEMTDKFNKMTNLIEKPQISICEEFPEVLLINNINNNKNNVMNPLLKNVIVDRSCGISILRGAHLYSPGVLAMESITRIDDHVNVFSDLKNACKKGTLIPIIDQPNVIYIGQGIVRKDRKCLFGENIMQKGIAVEMITTVSNVPSLGNSYIVDGVTLLQNMPSIICGHVLNPHENEIILDMCAAPGNKTTHLAELMKDRGTIIAVDNRKSRFDLLEENIKKYNFKSIHCFLYDSTKMLRTDENNSVESIDDQLTNSISNITLKIGLSPPYYPETFDKILLDGPCSGLGNRPQLYNDMPLTTIQSYPNVQKKLFEVAVGLLKVNGILVYSTCTITEMENEAIVSWALKRFTNIQLIPAEPRLGVFGWKSSLLNDEQRSYVQRYGFDVENKEENQSNLFNDTIGFFIAKFIKISRN